MGIINFFTKRRAYPKDSYPICNDISDVISFFAMILLCLKIASFYRTAAGFYSVIAFMVIIVLVWFWIKNRTTRCILKSGIAFVSLFFSIYS